MTDRPIARPSIMEIAPYVGGKSKAAPGQRILKLSSNENPLGPSPKAIAALSSLAESLHRYPNGGCTELRTAIADIYGLDSNRILCGAGSDELIGMLVHTYAGPGDEVLYCEHGFLMYRIYTQVAGATPVTATETNLTTDVDALLAKVTDKTRIVFVANPNNPTGSYISASELARLRTGLPDRVVLAVDAAYAEYVEADDYSAGLELAGSTPNTVMLRTFSKAYGLPALRIGWVYGAPEIIDALNRVRSPFNVNTAAQIAGIAAVQDQDWIARSRTHNTRCLDELEQAFSRLGLTVHPSVGNFLLVEFPGGEAEANVASDYLEERGVLVRKVGNYGLPACLRITIGTDEENAILTETLSAFIASQSGETAMRQAPAQ